MSLVEEGNSNASRSSSVHTCAQFLSYGSGREQLDVCDRAIEPEDGLHVAVFKEPDLTMSLPVRPDGKISMPLISDVQAAGLTPAQLAASITEKLKQYVAHPYVTVVVTAMANLANQRPRGEILHTEPLQWREGSASPNVAFESLLLLTMLDKPAKKCVHESISQFSCCRMES